MRRHVHVLAVFVALGVLVVLPVACGAGAGEVQPSQSSSTAGRVAVLDSPQGGFSIKYPADFVKIEPDVADQRGLIYQVLLADPTGAMSGGKTLDVLSVSVREMSKKARPGDLTKFRSQFEAMAQQLIGPVDSLRITGPFKLTKLGGSPALRVEYVYKVGGADVATVAYLVPRGKRVYWVTGQAGRETWGTTGREIGAAMSTITFSAATE
jgi:hypothetical protein